MKRWASSASDISRLNSATALFPCSATFSAMFVTSADLPIEGRAARMIRLPGWKPPVIASRSAKPDGGAGERLALGRELLPLVDLRVEDVADRAEVLLAVLVGDLEDRALGAVDELARRGLVAVDAGLDLVGRAQQAAEHRVLAHDARVLAHVADGGHGAGQQIDRGAAAGLVELAGELEVLGEREHVDRLARPVQVEHRLEDRAVALAVEVLGLEPLVDDQRGQRVSDSRIAPRTDCSASRFVRRRGGPSSARESPLV